ncbi:hypothetical protein BC936DRAFT_143032 [Jimgerdemannia flammicorona]|uniref:Uncharacterized protein n=1 Tax=Jimgerdemannia flammicorona TaxID=994334 RepID=A0A433DMW2_9FUNG|nr:hypothetical protein BC936DRAFT_143032 [Jimgerdemannia flammicorona]
MKGKHLITTYSNPNLPDNRICIESPLERREPDEQGRDDDANVAERIAQHVQEHAVHVEVAM